MVVIEAISADNASSSNVSNPMVVRRSSSRIAKLEKQRMEKKRKDKEELEALSKAVKPAKKKKKTEKSVSSSSSNFEIVKPASDVTMDDVENGGVGTSSEPAGEKSVYARVKDTIRTYYKYFLTFVQLEEKRCKKDGENEKNKKNSKSKKRKQLAEKSISENQDAEKKRRKKRPDLKALNMMITSNATLSCGNRIGSVPGVDVGHQFFSRCEMVTVGFHNHHMDGIDFIGSNKQKKYPKYQLPIAVGIVMSGMYEDDIDNSEDVEYTGQGGNDYLGKKHQIKDQVMTLGNLGLKNSMEQQVPVRVIRGHKSQSSYIGKVYTYDGLYKVDKYWAEKGESGHTIYKFALKRMQGQPRLLTKQVFFTRGRIPKKVSELQGLVSEDICGGLERIPIPATNMVDDPPVPPIGLTYINSMEVSKNVTLPPNAIGCKCQGSCTDPRSCACAKLNGSDFPYVHRDGGRLIESKDVVFECGPNCGCGPGCLNKTSQRALKYRLEVYKTPKKGWAVRSWDFIPSGAPVCEYIGVLNTTEDVEINPENNYLFDIDCLQTKKGLGGREKRVGEVALPSLPGKEDKKDSGPEFCIDAGTTGNVARYINHSCQPNLFVQCVLSVHHDPTQARIVLFAADNIQPLTELTYDYGYEMDSVLGPDGQIKKLDCFCGAPDCRQRLY